MGKSKEEDEDIEFGYISRPQKRSVQPNQTYQYLQKPLVVEFDEHKHQPLAVKLKERAKHNPFVIGGLGVTLYALLYGVYQLKTGNDYLGYRMQQLRVGAQAFTILAIVAGEWHWNYLKRKEREEKMLQQGMK